MQPDPQAFGRPQLSPSPPPRAEFALFQLSLERRTEMCQGSKNQSHTLDPRKKEYVKICHWYWSCFFSPFCQNSFCLKRDEKWKGYSTHHLLCLLFVLESRGAPFRWLSSQEMNAVAEPEYWVRHVAQAVRFFDAMKGCLARPIFEEWSLPSQGWLVFQTFQCSLFFDVRKKNISNQMATDLYTYGWYWPETKIYWIQFSKDFRSGHFWSNPRVRF